MKLPKFLVGLLIGGLLGIIFWYWQKSTSAEDGALSVLDRLSTSEAHVRDLESRLQMATAEATVPQESVEIVDAGAGTADNLQEIDGIGPTYSQRLQDAGIYSFADLAAQTPTQLVDISAARSEKATESWISAAQDRLNSR